MKTNYLAPALRGSQFGRTVSQTRLSLPITKPRPWGLRFTMLGLALSLLFSRIGLPVGPAQMSVVGPIVLALAAWGLLNGRMVFHKTRLALFILLTALTLASSGIVLVEPQLFGFSPSWPSLIQFLALTSLLSLRFTEPVEERSFYIGVNSVFGVIAIAGLLQFFLQFIGLGLFSFQGILPDNLLFEIGYNTQNQIGTTKYLKSNGFVLLEASMFSQYMALGLSIEILLMRRLRYVALMLAGLIVSLSGTGWLILGTFIVAVGIGLKGRGVMLAVTTVGLLATALVILAFLAPDFFDYFTSRTGEFSAQGSSGHLRFIAPYWTAQDVLWREPWAFWVGIGAGAGERLNILSRAQSLNTPMKVMIELGFPAMLAYIALLSAGGKTQAQKILLLPGLMMVLFTGSYAQMPPMLYPVILIACIATLKPSNAKAQGFNQATVPNGT